MRNADNKKLKSGLDMGTSMDGIPELQFDQNGDYYKKDNQRKYP